MLKRLEPFHFATLKPLIDQPSWSRVARLEQHGLFLVPVRLRLLCPSGDGEQDQESCWPGPVFHRDCPLARAACRANKGHRGRTTCSPTAATKLASARRTAFSALARVAPTTILEDATVPRSHLAEMVEFIQKTAEKYRVKIGTFGHMGDGNLHPTFLTDERNHDEMHRVELEVS